MNLQERVYKALKTYKKLYQNNKPEDDVYTWTSLLGEYLRGYFSSGCKDNEKDYQSIVFCGIEYNPNTDTVKIEQQLTSETQERFSINLEKWITKLEETLIKYSPDNKSELIKYCKTLDFIEPTQVQQINPNTLYLEEYRTKANILDKLLSKNTHFNN